MKRPCTASRARSQERVAEGAASLTAEGLTVGDHHFDLSQLRAVSVELQNRLTFRNGDDLLELVPDGQSPLKWAHFLRDRLG